MGIKAARPEKQGNTGFKSVYAACLFFLCMIMFFFCHFSSLFAAVHTEYLEVVNHTRAVSSLEQDSDSSLYVLPLGLPISLCPFLTLLINSCLGSSLLCVQIKPLLSWCCLGVCGESLGLFGLCWGVEERTRSCWPKWQFEGKVSPAFSSHGGACSEQRQEFRSCSCQTPLGTCSSGDYQRFERVCQVSSCLPLFQSDFSTTWL